MSRLCSISLMGAFKKHPSQPHLFPGAMLGRGCASAVVLPDLPSKPTVSPRRACSSYSPLLGPSAVMANVHVDFPFAKGEQCEGKGLVFIEHLLCARPCAK